jgi:hypothetical protein
MNIIRFVINEFGDNGQVSFDKETFRYMKSGVILTSTATIHLYFQTQGELYTHDEIQLTVDRNLLSTLISELMTEINKSGNTTIRHSQSKGLYKHLTAITYVAST